MTSSFIGKVLDNYRILENLGIGGMGVVFKAIHIKLDKVVALKIIAPGLALNENFIRRFQTEAKALAKLEDPNIVRINDLRADNDQWFIVMEYVDGINLADKIKEDGAYVWQEALPILKQILKAIGHAHASGIIHRDLKPNNVMINRDGVVKITDFGLAKDQTNVANTMTITSGGTLYYMSPEHLKGFSFTDQRSDIYSIGMTFYEMITGSIPFKNMESDFDIREAIVRKDFEQPTLYNSEIPKKLETIVMKAIAKEPKDRYQTNEEMLKDIEDFEASYGKSDTKVSSQSAEESSESISPIVIEAEKTVRDEESKIFNIAEMNREQVYKIGSAVGSLLLIFMLLLIYNADFVSQPSATNGIPDTASLTVLSKPAEAVVYLNGDSIGETPVESMTLTPDQYSLNISKDDHRPIDTTMVLTKGDQLGLSLSLQSSRPKETLVEKEKNPVSRRARSAPTFASLSVEAMPDNAEVWINGKFKGNSPLYMKRLGPGSYQIEVRKENYQPYRQELKLSAGNNKRVSAKLVLYTGRLSVAKAPATALILIDGEEVETENSSKVELNHIPIGKHQVEIVKPGYSSFAQEVDIQPNQIESVQAVLTRLKGELSIQVRPWGSIYVDGELKKASADTRYKVQLPVEQYELKVVHPTFGHWRKLVKIDADKTTNLTVDFNRKLALQVGAIDQEGNPLSANIYLDDQNTEKLTPDEISVYLGVHRLSVKKDGYITVNGEKEICVDEGSNNSQTFVLKKIE
jgi:serine/threonine protein kinase